MKQDCFIDKIGPFSADYDDLCRLMTRFNIVDEDTLFSIKLKMNNIYLSNDSAIRVYALNHCL